MTYDGDHAPSEERQPCLATDGANTWVAVWTSDDSPIGPSFVHSSVRCARSLDGGATWSAPVFLDPGAALDTFAGQIPQVVTDGAGTWLTVWTEFGSHNTSVHSDSDIQYSRSTDRGATWSAPRSLNTTGENDTGSDVSVQIDTDGEGRWVAVWQSYHSLDGTENRDYDIHVARSADGGLSWSSPAVLNSNASGDSYFDETPQISWCGGESWVAVWMLLEDQRGVYMGSILTSRSSDGGASWSDSAKMSSAVTGEHWPGFDPQVCSDASGNSVALWATRNSPNAALGTDADIVYVRSTDGGQHWSAPAALNGEASGDQREDIRPALAVDKVGNWMALWGSTGRRNSEWGRDSDILLVRSTDGGNTWTTPAALNLDATLDRRDDSHPHMAGDGHGAWVAAWSATENPYFNLTYDLDLQFARSLDGGETWDVPSLLDPATAGYSTEDYFPSIASDGTGTQLVIWTASNAFGGALGTDDDLLYSRSTDRGDTWSAPTALSAVSTSDNRIDQAPEVATDGVGTWVSVWEEVNLDQAPNGGWFKIRSSRSVDHGLTWSLPVPLDARDSEVDVLEGTPRIVSNGQGRWAAIWVWGSTSADYPCGIRCSRSSNNAQSWSGTVELVSDPQGCRIVDAPDVAADGYSTLVAVWRVYQILSGATTESDIIFYSRSTDGGQIWSAPAPFQIQIDSKRSGSSPRVATDGNGVWIVVWQSESTVHNPWGLDNDILYSRSTDGGETWAAPAALNNMAFEDVDDEYLPQIAADGGEHWIATWWKKDPGGAQPRDGYNLYTKSSDRGKTWSVPVPLNQMERSGSKARVASGGAGRWVAVWDSEHSCDGMTVTDSDIYVSTLSTGASEGEGEGEAEYPALEAVQDMLGRFGRADQNGDGHISFGEAGAFVSGMSLRQFSALDFTRDGVLRPSELHRFIEEQDAPPPFSCEGVMACAQQSVALVFGDLLILGIALGGLAVLGRSRRANQH
ncbi:MAG: exo-alpha-sialidase [Candidatus Hydrogenedentes bacterium]|nr:exo-alpha-sialidase [Candidatus Hydrogenedentota bacterium]